MLKDIYLVHHTHMDIGYTDQPGEVLDQHLVHLDTVLNLCRRNFGQPEREQYRWTCESALLIRNYLACRPGRQKEELLQALREGWIELQAFLTQPLTELPSAEELIECIGYAVELGRRESFSVECAMIDDIGGYAGRLPTVLAAWGVRYLVGGVGGFQVHMPWADLPHLFYLESKDSTRVLLWNLGINRNCKPQAMTELSAVYCAGGVHLVFPYLRQLMAESRLAVEPDVEMLRSSDCARSQFAELERRLESEDYPFEEVMLQYARDNGGPDADLVEAIKLMNEAGDLPHIHLTTPRHFFRHMEAKYGSVLPVLSGIITDPWNMRANPTPVSLKAFRKAQRTTRTAESRLALIPDAAANEADATVSAAAYENLHLYADHTYGLSEWFWRENFRAEIGCRDSAYDRYRGSWAHKHFYARAALSNAERLNNLACQRLGSGVSCDDPFVLVWNDRPWATSGPAELYLGRDGRSICGLIDPETSESIPLQRVGPNKYLLLSSRVPGMGYRMLKPVFGSMAPSDPAVFGGKLENAFLRLVFEPNSGHLVSVVNKIAGRECLDTESLIGLGQFIYHIVEDVPHGSQQAGMSKEWRGVPLPVRVDRVFEGLSGPVAQSIVVEEHVDGPSGAIRILREIILYHHAPRVDVRVRLDKPETDQKECCYVAFPLAGSDAEFRFDQNLGLVSPKLDLLPGAHQDAFYCHSWVSASGVTVACTDAPVFQLGGIRTGSWEDKLPFKAENNHLYGWLYHNLLNTDDPIWQDILEEFGFGLYFHHEKEFSHEETIRAAAEVNYPLRAEMRAANPLGNLSDVSSGFMEVDPASARIISTRSIAPNTVQIRVEETIGTPVDMCLIFRSPVAEAWCTDFFGEKQAQLTNIEGRSLRLRLQPYSLTTLRLRLESYVVK